MVGNFLLRRGHLILLGGAVIALVVLYGRPLAELLADRERVQEWLARLGPWGPLGLVLVSALQVVVAPVPGYFVQIAGGYLFGLWVGGVYSTIGMLLGGATAMMLARIFGRPLVAKITGKERLAHWEGVIRSDSPWTWFVLLLAPFGDIPWFLAGLSRVAVWRVILAGFISRSPSVFIAVGFGAGVELVPREFAVAFVVFLVVGTALFFRFRSRFEEWLERRVAARLGRRSDPSAQ
jgi:uncharacterized membrane protein YdjX (TVP38/TMEM64 family)